jgi:hypothetical protein
MMRMWITVAVALCATTCAWSAELIDGWQIHADRANSPLSFTVRGKTLEVIKGFGPVFAIGDSQIEPGDYTASVTSSTVEDGATVINCRADVEGTQQAYTLRLKKLPDGAMELIVDGGKNVSGFQCGSMTGDDAVFKRFYVGYRDAEAYPNAEGPMPIAYWPARKVFFTGGVDLDVSHGACYTHRVPARSSFIGVNTPIGADMCYALLTDGTRPALHERYVFRASSDLWSAMGPMPNTPSAYRHEMAEMIYCDLFDDNFAKQTFFMDWLKKNAGDVVKFYSVIEQWGGGGFDDTLPDLYRVPDFASPQPRYGTKEELQTFVSLCRTMGRVALRTNYMAIHPDTSFSFKEKKFTMALEADGKPKWHANLRTILPLVKFQDGEIHRDFGTTAAFSDQISSAGNSAVYVNCDAKEPGAGTISAARAALMTIAKTMKEIHNGPLGSESYMADYQFGEGMDTGDYQIFAGNQRHDFTPEEKLRRYHQLAVSHSMGLGYRFFFGPWEADWHPRGAELYFNHDDKLDAYRSCEILYGNGGYLYFYSCMRLVHALTECYTVGLAQRHYALQPIDYVKYGKGTVWKTLDALITAPEISSSAKLYEWYRRFHIRYQNGCHVYVNRSDTPMDVILPSKATCKLPKDGWLVYTEDGQFIAYTALVADPFFPANPGTRVDFAEDKKRGIRYVNPRGSHFMNVNKPTVWIDGKVRCVLDEPNLSFYELWDRSRTAATQPASH